MKTSHTLALLIIIASIFWLVTHKNTPKIKPSGKTIKIGIIAPFTGANKNMGEAGIKGIKIAQQLIPYLDNGNAVEWVYEDDQNTPELSITALKTLTEGNKVDAILLLSESDSALALAKIAEQYKTPILAVFASHPDLTKYSSLLNQFNFDDTFQATVAAFYVRDELLIDRVAVVAQSDNAHFTYLANEFSKQFNSTEGEITDRYDLPENHQDYLEMLQSIKAKDPELLYLPVSTGHLFEIKSAMTELDWNPKIMVSDGILASLKAQNKYQLDMMDGMLAIDAFSHDMEFTSLGEQLLEQSISMQISTQEIGTNSILAMEAYVFLMHVMNQCLEQKNKRLCINKAIRSTIRFEGVKGLISFTKDGKAHRSLSINKINDQITEFLVRVY